MAVEMITLVAGFALVLMTYDRLAAMLLTVALRADAIRVTPPDATCEALRSELRDLLEPAVPSIADGLPHRRALAEAVMGLKLTEA